MLMRGSGLRKSFGARNVMSSFAIGVEVGEVVAIVGPNGCGKSTLLECLAGAQPLDAGTVELDGVPSDPTSTHYWGMVYGVLDDFAWFDDLTIEEHLRLLEQVGTSDADGAVVPGLSAAEALDAMGLNGVALAMPHGLSSGQRQLAALASAFVRGARVLLRDEPERHLDERAEIEVGTQHVVTLRLLGAARRWRSAPALQRQWASTGAGSTVVLAAPAMLACWTCLAVLSLAVDLTTSWWLACLVHPALLIARHVSSLNPRPRLLLVTTPMGPLPLTTALRVISGYDVSLAMVWCMATLQ